MIIYKTTNLCNQKIYIGQDSKNNPKYLGSGLLLNHAIKKYGRENFIKEILEICETKDHLNKREIFWIKEYDSTNELIGYNISDGGTGGKLTKEEWKKGMTYEEAYGPEKSKLIKEKFSKLRKGKKRGFVNITSEEVGKKISSALKGKIHRNEETKYNISLGMKKFNETPQGKNNIKNFIKMLKKPRSAKSNLKRSNTMKGRRPKILEVHGSAKYWYFYDSNNNLILKTLGNINETLKQLNINMRNIKKFTILEDCLAYQFERNIKYKVFVKSYYDKKM